MQGFRVLSLAAALAVGMTSSVEAQRNRASVPDSLIPDVGEMAPEFTLPWADSSGVRSAPVKLSDLRGQVVVIAFYPADRTTGCTAEMTKFRDEYDKLFGPGVVVLPISKDGLESHASWAKDMRLPFALVSDTAFTVMDAYGSRRPGATSASRNTFVVGKDGRIVWRKLNFQALTETSYTEMAQEVARARVATPH